MGQKQFVLTQFTHQITWTVFTVHTFNPIPTGCCHVTLIYRLIPPMAGSNRVKNSKTERWMIISKTCSLICAVGENCGTMRSKPIWCWIGTFLEITMHFWVIKLYFSIFVKFLFTNMIDMSYEALQKKDSVRCMSIV